MGSEMESGDASQADTTFALNEQGGENKEVSPTIKERLDKYTIKRQQLLQEFLEAPRTRQRTIVEDKWARLSYDLVTKAQKYQVTATEKEFGRLTQLIISAATAKDKVFHREDKMEHKGNVVFNLFGNVGLDAIKKMLQPPIPTVKVLETKE